MNNWKYKIDISCNGVFGEAVKLSFIFCTANGTYVPVVTLVVAVAIEDMLACGSNCLIVGIAAVTGIGHYAFLCAGGSKCLFALVTGTAADITEIPVSVFAEGEVVICMDVLACGCDLY